MVERVAQLLHVFGDTMPAEDECVAVVTAIWARALGLQPEAPVAPVAPVRPAPRTRSAKGAKR
jgi:hypothetical protein